MKLGSVVATALVIGGLGATPAFADGDFSGTHDQVTIGNKVCFSDHEHAGVKTAGSSKLATKLAINAWSSFVKFEYGKVWANWNLAVGKSINCSGGQSDFTCDVRARVCRPKR